MIMVMLCLIEVKYIIVCTSLDGDSVLVIKHIVHTARP